MNKKKFFILIIVIIVIGLFACDKKKERAGKSTDEKNYKVTFIELGSVNCIPCRMMQPIMKEIEEKYGDQVKVIFYDVWTPDGRKYGVQYGIRVIPTQVFLDENGNEFYRHEGFLPKERILEILASKGVKIND